MTATETQELTTVLDRVRRWSPSLRLELARQVLQGLPAPSMELPPRRMPPERIVGLLKTSDPPPSDEQIRQIVEEERLRKHT